METRACDKMSSYNKTYIYLQPQQLIRDTAIFFAKFKLTFSKAKIKYI